MQAAFKDKNSITRDLKMVRSDKCFAGFVGFVLHHTVLQWKLKH